MTRYISVKTIWNKGKNAAHSRQAVTKFVAPRPRPERQPLNRPGAVYVKGVGDDERCYEALAIWSPPGFSQHRKIRTPPSHLHHLRPQHVENAVAVPALLPLGGALHDRLPAVVALDDRGQLRDVLEVGGRVLVVVPLCFFFLLLPPGLPEDDVGLADLVAGQVAEEVALQVLVVGRPPVRDSGPEEARNTPFCPFKGEISYHCFTGSQKYF